MKEIGFYHLYDHMKINWMRVEIVRALDEVFGAEFSVYSINSLDLVLTRRILGVA